MSVHCFGVTTEEIGKTLSRKIDRIATANGADFISANIPGSGRKHWFECPNRGNPFDQRTETAVFEALKAAGITILEP